ncbi:MAG: hypothetical protein U1D55_14110 [Phycisphaerae bacterium]
MGTANSRVLDIPTDARCRSCGYALVGLTVARCPECGLPFDPDDPTTYRSASGRALKPLEYVSAVGLALIMALTGISIVRSMFLEVSFDWIALVRECWTVWLPPWIVAISAICWRERHTGG